MPSKQAKNEEVDPTLQEAVDKETARLKDFYSKPFHDLPAWLTGPSGVNYSFNRPWSTKEFAGTQAGKEEGVSRFLFHQALQEAVRFTSGLGLSLGWGYAAVELRLALTLGSDSRHSGCDQTQA